VVVVNVPYDDFEKLINELETLARKEEGELDDLARFDPDAHLEKAAYAARLIRWADTVRLLKAEFDQATLHRLGSYSSPGKPD
jgi:uncharacterized protein YfaS (alpha-2-macroglobulin family)